MFFAKVTTLEEDTRADIAWDGAIHLAILWLERKYGDNNVRGLKKMGKIFIENHRQYCPNPIQTFLLFCRKIYLFKSNAWGDEDSTVSDAAHNVLGLGLGFPEILLWLKIYKSMHYSIHFHFNERKKNQHRS